MLPKELAKILLLLFGLRHQVSCSTESSRYHEPIPAMEFFERCNISAYLSEYCSPVYNLGVRNVYVGCGSGRIDART